MTDDSFTPETWIYAGRRLSGSKLVYAWQDAGGTVRYFSKEKHRVIGGAYELEVHRLEDGKVSVGFGGARYLEQPAGLEERQAWELEDRASYRRDQDRIAEQRLKRQSDLGSMTLDEARELVHRATPNQSWAMADAIKHYVMGGLS